MEEFKVSTEIGEEHIAKDGYTFNSTVLGS